MQVKAEAEKGRVLVRSVRKDIKEHLKQLQTAGASEDAVKIAEEQVQKLTDTYISKLDELLASKEKDVMEV
jgi:ribosome recycling factor